MRRCWPCCWGSGWSTSLSRSGDESTRQGNWRGAEAGGDPPLRTGGRCASIRDRAAADREQEVARAVPISEGDRASVARHWPARGAFGRAGATEEARHPRRAVSLEILAPALVRHSPVLLLGRAERGDGPFAREVPAGNGLSLLLGETGREGMGELH